VQKAGAEKRWRAAREGTGEAQGTPLPLNDTSYEKLGEILADNPNGVMAYRDELLSMLKVLDKEEHVAARGFYLTAWSGKASTHSTELRGASPISKPHA
jgi:hypothetical protein